LPQFRQPRKFSFLTFWKGNMLKGTSLLAAAADGGTHDLIGAVLTNGTMEDVLADLPAFDSTGSGVLPGFIELTMVG
jgi:hypothetical protein